MSLEVSIPDELADLLEGSTEDKAHRVREAVALSLYREGKGFALWPTRPPGYDRPWSPAYVASTPVPSRTLRAPDRTPDATPRPEDLQPGD